MQAEIEAGITNRAKRWQMFPANDTFGVVQTIMAGEEIGSVLPNVYNINVSSKP